MQMNGSDILVECLLEQGVDTVFGYPGGAVLNIYDALYKYSDRIRHVLTAHEQGASHAADGYARATGKVGVCIATSGPGATNLVTGIATAYMDSIPVVAITGNVSVPLLGRDSFQEVDITGITMPVTKHNYIVKRVEDLADTVREAFRIAASGAARPGADRYSQGCHRSADRLSAEALRRPAADAGAQRGAYHPDAGTSRGMPEAADLFRRRRIVVGSGGAACAAGGKAGYSGVCIHDGPRRFPGGPSAVARYGGDARHPRRQPCGTGM